jgi:phospholipase C
VALLTAALLAPAATAAASATSARTSIRHVVVIVQENHSFDSYFAAYCAQQHTCNLAPVTNPYAPLQPVPLTDANTAAYDPNHFQACENVEIDGGAMDGYATSHPAQTVSTGYPCGSPANVTQAAYGPTSPVSTYQSWAAGTASLADNYFQPLVGASSSNDMYLWTSKYVFTDNSAEPKAVGSQCPTARATTSYSQPNLGSLLSAHHVSWAWYAQGYSAMRTANSAGGCALPPADCPSHVPNYPCVFDPSDIPAEYFPDQVDQPAHMRDYSQLGTDVAAHQLPTVSFVKGLGYHSEHPGYGDTLSQGVQFVSNTVAEITRNVPDALVLLTWDESGGYFDHVAPPTGTAATAVDGQPYGPRVPLLALGAGAATGTVSHVQLEHSSIVKFIEWNFLGATGQLGGRDAVVRNLGSMLKPGLGVPS